MAKYTKFAGYSSASKTSKFNSKKNYSSFWMDDDNDYYTSSRFAGMGSTKRAASDDIVKVIKLASYQRAIANFVKILTKKNIPVVFKGDTSYTDFESVVLSTDIKDNNFDVSVGLALHEGSHIILTNPDYLKKMMEDINFPYSQPRDYYAWDLWKNMVNWIEDRRIDNFIFKTSPGYKAYYHKMYDHYWNDKSISKALASSNYRDASQIDSYTFRIINSLNPASDMNALPGLKDILTLIDTPRISRLNSVEEVGEIATKVVDIIYSNVKQAKNNPQSGNSQKQATGEGEGQGGTGTKSEAGNEPSNGNGGGDAQGDTTPGNGELSGSDYIQASNALQAQKDFLNGKIIKKSGTKSLQNKLKSVSNTNVEVQNVGGEGGVPDTNCLIYDLTGDSKVSKLANVNMSLAQVRKLSYEQQKLAGRDALVKEAYELQADLPSGFDMYASGHYGDIIQQGTDMGALLGKKLQVRNEVRELVHNRMRTGHIDNKRLASAGFGVESIFKQIHMDQYKKANLHISLDGSGSMGGIKWQNTIKMTMAIAKAASYVQNLDIQVSIRVTHNNGRTTIPVVVNAYDSRRNPLSHLKDVFNTFHPSSMTPEGLCFEAMIKRNMMIAGGNDVDSYFLNISDGAPGGVDQYQGQKAYDHTRAQVSNFKSQFNMQVLAFYMHDRGDKFLESMYAQSEFRNFQHMYGVKDTKTLEASDAMGIAKALNEKFLAGSSKI
jgi:hypothetical protein